MSSKEVLGDYSMKITEYIEYDEYKAVLQIAEGKLTSEDMLLRTEKNIGELVTSDVLLALGEYMPELPAEWLKMLFAANLPHNLWLTEQGNHGRTTLGWMYANMVIDLHKKSGHA